MPATLHHYDPVQIDLSDAVIDLPIPTGHDAVKRNPNRFDRLGDHVFAVECADVTLNFTGSRDRCLAIERLFRELLDDDADTAPTPDAA